MPVLWIVLGLMGLTLAVLIAFGGDGTVGGIDGDQIARGVGLVAILAVLVMGMANSRLRMQHALRNIAIWLAIAVGLLLLYQSSEAVRGMIN